MFRRTMSALVFSALLAGFALQAQQAPQRVSVPFKFNLTDKAYEPAMYYFRYESSSGQVELLNRDKALITRVHVITRLTPTPGAKRDGSIRLVFDQVGQDRFLSEIWMPGADGLLVRATTERREHESAAGLMK